MVFVIIFFTFFVMFTIFLLADILAEQYAKKEGKSRKTDRILKN